MIILNLKTYRESTGKLGQNLLDSIEELSQQNSKVNSLVSIAPSLVDISWAKFKHPNLNIIAQHIDRYEQGKSTGWIIPENLKEIGVYHSLYNHSEHRIKDSVVENIKDIQSRGIHLIVCCESLSEAETYLQAKPYAIAYEAPELIGSDISITTRPEIIRDFLSIVKGKTISLIGAGIASKRDIERGLELDADGFLVSKSIVQSPEPIVKLRDLLSPFTR